MKIKVIQSYKAQSKDGAWIDYHVGQEIEIEPKDFSPNLHGKIDMKLRRSKPYIEQGPGEPESEGPGSKEK